MTSKQALIVLQQIIIFTPLESPTIYVGDGGNRKHQLLIEGMVKAMPFLTGFTQRVILS